MTSSDDHGRPTRVVTRVFAAREEGRVEDLLAALAPDIEIELLADGRTLRGVDAVRRFLDDGERGGLRTETRADVVQALGDKVLVEGRMRAFLDNAISDSPAYWIFHVVDGLVRRIEAFRSRADAEAAFGVETT